jgi:hypothetical protein
MEMPLGLCYDCPLALRHFLLGLFGAVLLSGLAVAFARGRILVLSRLFALLAWSVLAVCAGLAWRAGIDWRWSRSDLDFVTSRAADRAVALVLLLILLGSVQAMLALWRRRLQRGGSVPAREESR